MKKRLLCLFLGLIMVLSVVLTACSNEDEDDADVEEANAQTITMRLISEKRVCNTDEELAAYLADECGGDENSEKYLDMVKTKAAYDAVEAEFTKLTKSKYKVNVDLIFSTEDEYFDSLKVTMERYATEAQNAELAERALNKYISDYQAAYPEANYPAKRLAEEFYKYFPEYEKYKDLASFEDDEDETGGGAIEEQYEENDLGIKELVYPATEENQLDIIYVSGLDMYNEYIENEWLTGLDQYISTTGRKLNDYITGALLGGVKVDGSTYAIPNNIQIGEYTYMLVDKTLFDKYYYNSENVKSVLDLNFFLEDIKNSEPEVLPLDATFEECMDQFVWYWNIEWTEDEETGEFTYTIPAKNDFSILGALYGDPAKAGRGQIQYGFNTLFTDAEYREIYLRLMEYKYNGYYVTENDASTEAAVTFVKGDYTIMKTIDEAIKKNNKNHAAGVYTDENGKEYYAYVVKYPEADEHSLYGNMYGISSNSKHIQACIQVLTLINTNAEARNILQYGVKGVNYVIDEDTGMLRRLNKSYMMDIEKTGNCFIAHPEEGLPADYWENSKEQNNDALINPLLGFDFNDELAEYSAKLDNKLWNNQIELARQTQAKIDDCADYDELYELIENKTSGLCSTLAGNPQMYIEGFPDPITVNLNKLTNPQYDTASGLGEGPDGPIADLNGESPYTIYYSWMTTYGFLPKAK